MISARERRARTLPENRARFPRQELNRPAKGSPVRKDSPGRGRWHESAERGRLDAKRAERFYTFTKEIFIMNGLVALGAGIAALTGIGGGIGIGIATGKATEAISRQPEASNKIQTNLLLGAALAEGTAIFGFVVALIIILFLG